MQLDHYQDLPDHDHADHVSDQADDDNSPNWRGILRKSDSKINLNDWRLKKKNEERKKERMDSFFYTFLCCVNE